MSELLKDVRCLEGRTILECIRDIIHKKQGNQDAFYFADLSDVVRKWTLWTQKLPHVKPHYAFKCNTCPPVSSVLHQLGAGFDCASWGEIQLLLGMGVPPSDIIYANTVKQRSHLAQAAKVRVHLMTFDSEEELFKVKEVHPQARLLLRLQAVRGYKYDHALDHKFGAHLDAVPHLVQLIKDLGLNLVGISYHVGSGAYSTEPQVKALINARKVFDMAAEMGITMTILDIGGGFPGNTQTPTFTEISDAILPALAEYFPPEQGVTVIAEPGQYFVSSAFSLIVNVIGKRAHRDDEGRPEMIEYFVNDGKHGSFSVNGLVRNQRPELVHPKSTDRHIPCTIWGPTMDLDCVLDDITLPELEIGDWLLFRNMGAYTLSLASTFNSCPVPPGYFYISETDRSLLLGSKSESLDTYL